jgi:hypothetical protein
MKSPEHQKRAIREYVISQSPADTTISHLEKLASERVLGRKHDIWDVHASDGRWWVITDPTNLYAQDRFPSMDETLSFHVGLMLRVMSREDREPRAGLEEGARLSQTWRRFEQAAVALDAAEEAEDFQAVGMRCREVLLTFIGEVTEANMVPEGQDPPKGADFTGWSDLLSQHLCKGRSSARLRSYMQALLGETWRYVNWLTHAKNANRFDSELAIEMLNSNLSLVARVLVHSERKLPGRCPMCGSYQLYADLREELMTAGLEWPYVMLCEACGWEGEEGIEPPGKSGADEIAVVPPSP